VAFGQGLWTFLWFGGLALFAVLATIVIVRGGADLAALLRALRAGRATRARD